MTFPAVGEDIRNYKQTDTLFVLQVEAQLSDNIDVLASRLAELEDECQQLRDQYTALEDTHSLCSTTINMLQEQLNRSQQVSGLSFL